MSTVASPSPGVGCAVTGVVTYMHVVDVEASLAFYARLGFVPQRVMRDHAGRAFWALVESGAGELMLARADGPIDAGRQAVLLYMYSDDVSALRRHLLASGVRDGGLYRGVASPGDGPGTVYEVARPSHMPAGELRVVDSDGYVILVGQLR